MDWVFSVRQILLLFASETSIQCRFALRAGGLLRASLSARDTELVFLHVQTFLVAAANVSKILWPPAPPPWRRREPEWRRRGEILRQLFGVPEDSILAPRTFRDHFEHFDERLESWTMSSPRRNFVDMNIMPPGAIAGVDPHDFHRNLDPSSLILTFGGDTYDIPKVEAALKGIVQTAEYTKLALLR